MEQDCRVVRTDSEEHKVTIATMYFTGDAKLWWRSKVEDIQNNRCTISTRAQTRAIPPRKFGVEYIARCKLRELQQTGSGEKFLPFRFFYSTISFQSSHRYALLLRAFFSDIVDRSFSLIEELAFE